MKMMKMATLLTILILSSTVMAKTVKEIKACTSKQLIALNEEIQSQKNDNHPFHKLLKNSKNEIVGFYAWSSDEYSMYTEVCEYVDEENFTVANQWYYWDEGSTNPKDFKKGLSYRISQDEGIADFKILSQDQAGKIKLQFEILGWEDADTVVLRRSILTLE
jgi:hypothetical protein